MSDVVTYRLESDIGVIAIDNPPVNALGHAVREGLLAALDKGLADGSARALVIIGAGRTFPAGADIKEFGQTPKEPSLPEVIDRIEAADKLTIAAVHGTALGGGMEVTLGCDYRVATADARMGLPEVNLGLLPGAGGTQRLPRLIGQSRAMDLVLTGREVGTDEALEIGLANRRAEAGGALEAAKALARDIAGFPQVCMRTDRASVLSQWGLDEQAALRAEIEGGIKVIETGETQAGATRFKSGSGRHGKF